MSPELSIEAISHDLSDIGIVIKASNDRFAGTAQFWMDIGCEPLIDLANQLNGFPEALDHVEEWTYGFAGDLQENPTVGPRPGRAFVHLKVLCLDSKGHLAADITIHEDPWFVRDEGKGKVFLEMQFDPAQLDSFIRDLKALAQRKEGLAVLAGRQPSTLDKS